LAGAGRATKGAVGATRQSPVTAACLQHRSFLTIRGTAVARHRGGRTLQPMTAQTPTIERQSPATTQPHRPPRALRVLGVAAVGLGVAALAGATFVLSYSAIHSLALQAGVTPRLARGYPLLIDAMLVIVLAAVLALRGASLPSKLLAWATLLALLAAAAGADALHAAGRKLPERGAAIGAAVLPWVLVFLAFVLLLAMLRYARLRRVSDATTLADQPDALLETDDTAASDDTAATAEPAEEDMPVFHRMWSSPTPPASNHPPASNQ
jgi:hypothetical protein